MSQTTVQKSDAIRIGSVKMEVAETVAGPWTDLGALRGAQVQETFEKVKVESDNAGTIKEYIKDQMVQIQAQLLEYDVEVLDKLRGDIDEYSTTAGSLVSGATQTIDSGDWAYEEFIPIENQNGDGSAITVNSVSATDPATLTEGTDYFVVKDDEGVYGIIVTDSANMTGGDGETQDLTIDYDYTPNTAKNVTTGGKKTLSNFAVRLTNQNEDGNDWKLLIYKCTIDEGLNYTYSSDEADDVTPMPISFTGILDTSRSAGDQLYSIVDEQSTT